MNRFDLEEATIAQIQARFQNGSLTSHQLVSHYLAQIETNDQQGAELNAIAVINQNALHEAQQLDQEYKATGPRSLLHGIPVLVKDNYETWDMQTAAGSILLKGWIPPEDAFIVKKLRQAGAIILAKTNMHEFALGIITIGSLFGATRNPYKLDRNPGGSSGGTGAAVAANFGVVGWGTDTCGSITIPAAHNNLFGIRATQGLASQTGIIPLSRTQDVGGPLARTVTDLAIAFDFTVGRDPQDPQTAEADNHTPPSYTDNLDLNGLQGARIGLLIDLLQPEEGDQPVAELVKQAAVAMQAQGAFVTDISIPNLHDLLNDKLGGFLVLNSEVKPSLNRYLAHRPSAPINSFDEILAQKRVQKSIQRTLQMHQALKTVESGEYEEQLQKRTTLKEAIYHTMDHFGVDVLIYPTIRRTAMPLGARQIGGSNAKLSSNSGLPVLSMPVGFTPEGLPVGVNLLGREWAEPHLFKLAFAYEQATIHRRPPTSTQTPV